MATDFLSVLFLVIDRKHGKNDKKSNDLSSFNYISTYFIWRWTDSRASKKHSTKLINNIRLLIGTKKELGFM